MKKIISSVILLNILFWSQQGFSQLIVTPTATPNPTSSPNKFTFSFVCRDISNSSISVQVPKPISGPPDTPRISTWIEFGDGNFAGGNTIDHYYRTSFSYLPFMKPSGIYTGTGRPPAKALFQSTSELATAAASAASSNPNSNYPVLFSGKHVGITPSTMDICAADTMHFAITYQLPATAPGSDWILVFGYNSMEPNLNQPGYHVPAQSVFDVTNPLATMSIASGSSVNFVRDVMRLNQDITFNPTNLPASLPPHSNYIAYNVPAINNLIDTARNLFITLLPKLSDAPGTKVSAYLLKKKCTKDKIPVCSYEFPGDDPSLYRDTLDMTNRGSNPHDPNFETVYPACQELEKKPGDSLHYHVHFQNTGTGQATNVKVTINIPAGVPLANINLSSVVYKVGNRKYSFGSGLTSYSPSPVLDHVSHTMICEFNYNDPAESFVLDAMKQCMMEVKTMGDIWFDVSTFGTTGNTFISRSSIVFSNSTASQPAIITNEARSEYKKHCVECDCKPNPCKKRNRFWQWLLCKKC